MLYRLLCLLSLASLLFLGSCYHFDPIAEEVELEPNFALPLAKVNQSIESSLVLLGNPEINLEEELPEFAKRRKVFFIDTVDFSLHDVYEHTQHVRFIEFSLSVYNDFPSNADAQIVFLNDSVGPVDSLFLSGPFAVGGSLVSLQGDVLKRGESRTTMPFSRDRVDNLREANRLVVRCSVNNEGVPVEYFQNYLGYYLAVNIGARVGLTFQIN